ncbi:hypothetical protein D3C87_755070 [compost metagenome]
MSDWKFRQAVYHRLNRTHPDEYGPDDIVILTQEPGDTTLDWVGRYMAGWVPDLVVYPAKSYFVALVYARLLRDHFQEDPMVVLDDPDLLHGNDPYFVRYSEAREIYDPIIEKYGWEFSLTAGEIPDVEDYFRREFMLDQDA